MTTSITTERLLPHPPTQVWRALTDADLLGRWLIPNTFAPVVGHRFTMETRGWGTVKCQVLELEAERRLTYAWRNGPLDTTVTWRLVPEGDGTRLHMEHAGFDLTQPVHKMAYDGMSGGWVAIVGERLPEVLAGM